MPSTDTSTSMGKIPASAFDIELSIKYRLWKQLRSVSTPAVAGCSASSELCGSVWTSGFGRNSKRTSLRSRETLLDTTSQPTTVQPSRQSVSQFGVGPLVCGVYVLYSRDQLLLTSAPACSYTQTAHSTVLTVCTLPRSMVGRTGANEVVKGGDDSLPCWRRFVSPDWSRLVDR